MASKQQQKQQQQEQQSWTVDTIVKKSNPPRMAPPAFKSGNKMAKIPTLEVPRDESTESGLIVMIEMTYKKETPGTYVYASDDPDAAVTQLYIRKGGMKDGAKKTITITVR